MTYQNAGNIGFDNGFGAVSRVRRSPYRAAGTGSRATALRCPQQVRRQVKRADDRTCRDEVRMAAARRAEADLRRERDAELRRARYERELRRIKEYEKAAKREHAAMRKREAARAKAQRKRADAEILSREVKVERRRISVPFIVSVIIAFVLLMGVIYSFSEVAESSAQLNSIKTSLAEIDTESDKLMLELEEKNDLGTIEKRATEELMMVSENSVEKKYISVTGGDRVVLENDDSENSEGFLGGLLSSFSTAIDGFLDYLH